METPIFKLIEEDLKSYRETIDKVLNELNEIDPHCKNAPYIALFIGRNIMDEYMFPIFEKINILSFKVSTFTQEDIQE